MDRYLNLMFTMEMMGYTSHDYCMTDQLSAESKKKPRKYVDVISSNAGLDVMLSTY